MEKGNQQKLLQYKSKSGCKMPGMKVSDSMLTYWWKCYSVPTGVICWSAAYVRKEQPLKELVCVHPLLLSIYPECMCDKVGNQKGLLTIPGVLGLSAGLWVKLPLWLVDTVCDFLLLRPMASIDWLLLRMTRYREKWGDPVSVDSMWKHNTLTNIPRN